MLYKLFTKIKACIALNELRATDELMAIFRTIIETFLIYGVLWDADDKTIERFHYFSWKTLEFSRTGTVPKEIEEEANKLMINNKINYLNYGWLLSLKEAKNYKSKYKDTNIQLLANLFDEKYKAIDNNYGKGLYKIYKGCNPQSHTTSYMMNYFQAELSTFQNIGGILIFICDVIFNNVFTFGFNINGVNILEKTKEYLKQSKNLCTLLSNSQELLNKTNSDFVNRSACVSKIKGI